MTEAPITPDNEKERLEALKRARILDTDPEERFDRIARVAKHIMDAPIALVTLVDTDRQWFKAKLGLEVAETPREISFCGHAILEDKVLYIPNAKEDIRFCMNPLVTDLPHIRSYIGVPLHSPDGFRLGSLCAIDTKPTNYSDIQIQSLKDLAKCVETELSQNLKT